MTARRGSNGPQPYDFRRPIKLSREHVRMLQIVFETLLRRFPTLRLAKPVEELRFRTDMVFYGVHELPVTW